MPVMISHCLCSLCFHLVFSSFPLRRVNVRFLARSQFDFECTNLHDGCELFIRTSVILLYSRWPLTSCIVYNINWKFLSNRAFSCFSRKHAQRESSARCNSSYASIELMARTNKRTAMIERLDWDQALSKPYKMCLSSCNDTEITDIDHTNMKIHIIEL